MVWLDFELDSWMERYRAEFHTCVRCELKLPRGESSTTVSIDASWTHDRHRMHALILRSPLQAPMATRRMCFSLNMARATESANVAARSCFLLFDPT